MEERLWRKAGLLLLDSGIQPSSARASCPAHINHFSSLLRGVSSVVATIAEEPLMCFWMDDIKPASPFPSLPLVCVSAIQWDLVQFWGFPGGSDSKESVCNAGRPGFTPWVGKIPWRRKWQLTPVFLPGEFHGQRSLVGCSPWDHRIRHKWVTNTYLLNLEVTNMNKNTFLSVKGTIIYAQHRLFPFNQNMLAEK